MPILSPSRNTGGNQPLQKGPFFIFLMIVPVFAVLIVMILLIMQYKQLKSFVAPEAAAMPKLESTPADQEQVRARLQAFLAAPASMSADSAAKLDSAKTAKATGTHPSQAADTLALTAVDLNHLIRSSSSLEKLKLDYHLELQDTVLVARNSLPVERLIGPLSTMAKVLNMKGYLNSEMKGYPSLEGGKVILVPTSAVMNGIPAPASVLNAKGKLDLRDWVGDTAFYDRALAGLKGIRIREGRLLLIRG